MKKVLYKRNLSQNEPFERQITNRAASMLEKLSSNHIVVFGFKIIEPNDTDLAAHGDVELIEDYDSMRAIIELKEKGLLYLTANSGGQYWCKKREMVEID